MERKPEEKMIDSLYIIYTEADKRTCACCKGFLVKGDPGLIVSKWRSTIFDSNPYCQSCTNKIALFQRKTGKESYIFETDILNPVYDPLQKCTRSSKYY